MRTILFNAKILHVDHEEPQQGGLLIDGNRIIEISPKLADRAAAPSARKAIDCKGHTIIPGLIDGRVHCREPGEEHKETIATAAAAALKSGITTLIQRPDTLPPVDNVAMIERIKTLGEAHGTRFYPIGAISKALNGQDLCEIGLMKQAGALAFGDGESPIKSAKLLRRALAYGKAHDALILDLPQTADLVEGGVMNAGVTATRMGLSGIPAIAEVIQVERNLRILESVAGAKLHLSLITTKASIDAIRHAKQQGLDVTCDTAPSYFMMNEMDIGTYRTFAKIFPPLRDERDRKAVREGLCDGTIDMVVSDHNPQDQESKRVPFGQAEFGSIGLETLLPALLSFYHSGEMSLKQAINLATQAPAKRYGLQSGSLQKGNQADLSLINPDYSWQVKDKDLTSKSKNTIFEGVMVQGKILLTMIDGKILYQSPDF